MTKAEMIQQCKAGDKKAMEELYSAYSKRMLGIIRKYISDEETARDILHDGFVIIFTHISEIKDCNKAEYWMGTIMKNLSIQYLSQLDIYSTLDGDSDDIADSSDIADLLSYEELNAIMDVRQFVGCAAEQTEEFVTDVVLPLLRDNPFDENAASVIRV